MGTYSYKKNKDGKLVSTYHPTFETNVDKFMSELNETCAAIFTQGMDPDLKAVITQDFTGHK